MKNTITITSKGQTTLPIQMRRKLGLGTTGGVLQATFDEHKGELIISKPLSLAELSRKISQYITPGTKPVINVDNYYQKNRNA